ncbi:MAG: putative ABC exporter domain-containing protein [Clostridia bacterium]|nr:putative ABC exporter domain-containing protein [Clostridia bacterium]
MGALSYLFFTKQKNRFREYLRSPSKLIFLLVMLLMFGMSLYTSLSDDPSQKYRSIDEFLAIVFLIYTVAFADVSKNGFSNGASFFSMADINLIFVSPLRSANALFYGLIQQLGHSLYMGVIILLQYTISHEYYGISLKTLAFVALGYGITVFFGQMLSMLIYVFTASSDKRVRIGKIIYYSVLAFFVIYVIIKGELFTSPSLANMIKAVESDVLYFMPVSGLTSFFVEGLVKGSALKSCVGALLILFFTVAFYFILSKTRGEYYEDVLKSTETSSSAITSSKESTSFDGLSRNIKVGKTGFTKGVGASAISEKHKIENRRGKLIFLNRSSFVTIGMTVIYSLVVNGDEMMAFVLSLYSMLIGVSVGRWMKELTLPYVYLIPEKPFSKLLHVVREQIPVIIFESAALFAVLHFVLHLQVAETLSMLVARIGFGLVFIGSNLLFIKLTKRTAKTFLTIIAYTVLSTVCVLPSALCGIFAGMMFWVHPFTGYLITFPINIAVFLLLLFLCRNILEYSEFNNQER